MPKYMKISVPKFNNDGATPMSSYLRLGSVEDAATAGSLDVALGSETGEDLAAKVRSFIDDNRQRCAAGADPEPAMGTAHLQALIDVLQAERDMEQQRCDFLLQTLEALEKDPGQWLTDLSVQVEATLNTMTELEKEIDAERAKLLAAAKPKRSSTAAAAPEFKQPDYCGDYLTPSQRQAVTKKLHTHTSAHPFPAQL